MKKLVLLFLFVAVSLQAQLNFVESYPVDGATGVGLTDTLSVTFSTALDTNYGIKFGESFFTNISPETDMWLSSDLRTVYFAPNLEENKTYFILFLSAVAEDSSSLEAPFLIQFTTDTVFSGYTVAGNVSFEDESISPENTLVALLRNKLTGGEPEILFMNVTESNGNFSIEHVPNGVYYPIAAKDINGDGSIDPGRGDVLAKGDSIIVDGTDVSGVALLLKKFEKVRFARAKALIDSIKSGIFFRNLRLYYVSTWQVDSLAGAEDWEFLFVNTLTQQLLRVDVNPEGHTIEQLDANFFNWIRHFRPIGDSLSFAAVPDSFLARVERRVGRAIRHRHLPDSLELQVQLSLGDIARDGFWQVVPDTSRFYWGLKYRIFNRNRHPNDGEAYLAKNSSVVENDEEHLFLADYKTGQEVQVTGVNKRNTKLPGNYSLEQNYPNPFNPSTVIRYSLPNNEFVTLKVYNILGKEITTLVNQKQSSGTYEVNFDASNLTSGIYFYQISTNNFSQVRKMMLLK